MKRLTKKGFNIQDVPMIAVVLGVIAIVLGLMTTVLSQIQSSNCLYGQGVGGCLNSTGGTGGALGANAAANITQLGIQAQVIMASWQSTWVVIIAAAIVIGIVGSYLMFKPKE